MINNYVLRARDYLQKNEKDVLFFIVLFLIASSGFAMGYLSANEFNRAVIVIEQCSARDLVGN